MEKRKGFTLIELMVVILIVSILAAVAIPIMRGRIDSAKWSEGKAMMGTIATAIRAYCAETDDSEKATALEGEFDDGWGEALGFQSGDLKGTYFTSADFTIDDVTYDPNQETNPLQFEITALKPSLDPDSYTLTEIGSWDGSH
jgi:prepilin-type N-terminal cleavage/methylation domain-containing protein